MTTQDENKEIVRKVEEAWDAGNTDALDDLFAADFDNSQNAAPGLPPGLAGAKMAHGAAMQSFPDRKAVIEDMIADGDKVVVRGRITGTNKGGVQFLGDPANDKPIDFEYIVVYRLKDRKIVQSWALNDVPTLMMQLGAMPAPGA